MINPFGIAFAKWHDARESTRWISFSRRPNIEQGKRMGPIRLTHQKSLNWSFWK